MMDTVVFDIGNVLVQWDPRHLWASFSRTSLRPPRVCISGVSEG